MNVKKEDNWIDHINNDKLDNRKPNLRFATPAQNAQNKNKPDNCSSKYLGVKLDKKSNKWVCAIRHKGVRKSYVFKDEKYAAYWYDTLALRYHGEYAKTNKIEKPVDFTEPIIKEGRQLPIGVVLRSNGRYMAKLSNKSLGTYGTAEEAEKIYKNALGKKLAKMNIKKIIQKNNSDAATLYTSKNEEILVDDEDYLNLMQYTWCLNAGGYAYRTLNNKIDLMHRLIMDSDELIDHINHIRTDNRRSNLRISNSSLNAHNNTKQKNTSSKYKGVCYSKHTNKYSSRIICNKKIYNLGTFETEIEAANAYNIKAIELYGEYASLNKTP